MAKWVECVCYECSGYGVVGRGFDMLPEDCPACEGNRVVFISEGNRVALYPGGPFKGSWPGKYQELVGGKQ